MTAIGALDEPTDAAPTDGARPDVAREPAALPPEIAASIHVLVVDDEPTLREGCAGMLRSYGYSVTALGRGEEALALVRHRRFDIVLLDLYLRPVSGLDILRAAREAHPDTLVIIMTGRPTLSSSTEALRAGAWDYLPKPFSSTHLEIVLGRAVQTLFAPRTRDAAAAPVHEQVVPHEGAVLLGGSPVFRNVVDLARRIARTDAPVMIVGEPGTGKALLARFIHLQSRRAHGVFLPVQCGALCDAELLAPGAGAEEARAGLLGAARGGTIFLAGLLSLALPAQARLVRLLQESGPRGARRDEPALDVRLVSAVEQPPEDAVRTGTLRHDLLQRLCAVPVRMPALRERADDIPLLAQHYLAHGWRRQRGTGSPPPTLRADTLEWLRALGWPGNVRQLQQTMQRVALLVEPGSEVGREHIPLTDDERLRAPVCPGLSPAIIDDEYGAAKEKVLTLFEREYLPRLLHRAGGNIARAARLASVDRTTLYRLMEKHGLHPQGPN